MNILTKIFLSFLFIPVFLTLLIFASIRFQLLSPDFWINSYQKHDVYQKLEQAVPKAIEAQSEKEESSEEELRGVSQIASILNSDSLKAIVEKNIKYSIDYFDGRTSQWIVYLPTDALPRGLLPNFLLDENEVPVTALTSFYSRGEDTQAEVPLWIPFIGRSSWIALGVSAFIFLIFALILFSVGALPFALITSGLLTLIAAGGSNLALSAIEIEWAREAEPSQILLGALGIPLVREVAVLWIYIAIAALVLGIAFAFLSKRGVK